MAKPERAPRKSSQERKQDRAVLKAAARQARSERPRGRFRLLPRLKRSAPPPRDGYGPVGLLAGYRRHAVSRRVQMALYLALTVICVGWGFLFGATAPFQIMPLIAPLPVMALLIVWILPSGEYAPTNLLEPLYLAFFASLMLWPNYIAIAPPHMPWLTLLRIFAAPMVLIMLVGISVSEQFRREIWGAISFDSWIWRMLLFFAILQTISLGLSRTPVFSLNRYIVAQLNQNGIFIVSCYVFMFRGFADRWVKMLIATAYVSCIFGFWDGGLARVPWAGHIPSFLKIEGDLVESILAGAARSNVGIHRVQGISTTSLGLAELLGWVAPFALHVLVSNEKPLYRILAGAYLPMALMVILLTDSRLGIVTLLGSALFYVLIWAILQWRRNQQSIFAPALVLLYPLLFVATILATFFIGKLRAKVWGGGAEQASTQSRLTQWEMAIPKIATHPLGHGIGVAGREVGFVSPSGKPTLDSYYISILMDFGIFGFILFFGLFLRAAWLASSVVIKDRPNGELMLLLPMAVCLLNFVVGKSVFSQDANHPLVFMVLGGIVALIYRARGGVTKDYGVKAA